MTESHRLPEHQIEEVYPRQIITFEARTVETVILQINGASLYEYTRQFDATLAAIRLRLEANPNNPDLIGLEMEIQRRMGNYKEAVDTWAKWHILMGDPSRPVAEAGAAAFSC